MPEVIDLSNVKAASFAVLPRGWYNGVIEGCEYGLSQGKGLPMITWEIEIDTGEVDDDGDPVMRTVRWYTTLVGEAAGFSKASIARLDPDLDLATFAPDNMDAHFSDMPVRVRLTIRKDRDDKKIRRNNVADVVPLEDADFADE